MSPLTVGKRFSLTGNLEEKTEKFAKKCLQLNASTVSEKLASNNSRNERALQKY